MKSKMREKEKHYEKSKKKKIYEIQKGEIPSKPRVKKQ